MQCLTNGLTRSLASGSDDRQEIRQLPLFLSLNGMEPGIDLRQGVEPDVLPGMAMGDQALAGIGPAH
ncbi:MAG: hypothetical protein ACK52G_04340 [Betaproteobacteria bacterium]